VDAVTTAETPAPKGSGLARVQAFLAAVRVELGRVSWPPKPELTKATRMIVILSIVLGIGIGILDFFLQKLLVDGVAALAR
jgi:preprotein translocase SecE subunit